MMSHRSCAWRSYKFANVSSSFETTAWDTAASVLEKSIKLQKGLLAKEYGKDLIEKEFLNSALGLKGLNLCVLTPRWSSTTWLARLPISLASWSVPVVA